MTVQCCVCKKIKLEDSWTKSQLERPHDVSHTYCPACLRVSEAAMAIERLQANAVHPLTA